ncbi:LTA synthase family protein [Clostridium sp. SYSU_GA19001]|uniref:LTA synthase family protein n=1 Tax=Clostridium caldaquaticum TaxID=2940653 RepID=UPI002076E6B7|nr:LTA synthase family protein [Clostridium caldaquaticum]MCM8711313.1 LTA synthase family protein [Clostridium caldaquaticum]
MLNTRNLIDYRLKCNFKSSIKQNLYYLSKDRMLHVTLISLFLKSIIFTLLINSEKATKINFGWAFYGDPHLLVYICFINIFLSFSFLFKNRGRLWYLIVINTLISMIIIADLWYYRGFASFMTIHVLNQTTNLDNLSSDIIAMMRVIDIFFVLDIFVLIPLAIKQKHLYKNQGKVPSLFFSILVLSIGYIWFSHYRIDILNNGKKTMLFRTYWKPAQTMANLSPIGYHIYDSYNYWLDNKAYNLTEQDIKEINAWFKAKNEKLPDNKYKGLLKGKNLIIIQVESLERFVIGQKINGQEITPNLNKLLKNSLYFTNYYEQVNNGTSSDSDLLTNTSVYPVRRGSTFFRYPDNTYNSLPKLLEKLGYSTTAIHPEKGSYWNWMPALKSIGFQNTIDSSGFEIDETIGLGLSDGSYLRQVFPIIKRQKQPFYTFMVTLTSHGPFDLPEKFRELNLNESLDKTKMGGYLQSVHYTDKHIGLLINRLEKDGILNNSVIVVYGDHTGIHKYHEDEVAKIKPQEDWWQGNNWRVPLIIYNKDLTGEEITTIGGQVDLLPTLAYLFGIDKTDYEYTAIGRNLLNTKKNFAVLTNGSYIGEKSSDEEEQQAIKGLEIADKIIKSNYYKNYK